MLEPDPEQAVAYGLFSLGQARAAGFRDAEIRRRVARGGWRRLGHGVLVEEGRAQRPGDHLVVAVLRGGPGAVLGFEAAAAVHGWDCVDPQAEPRLIVPKHRSRGDGYHLTLGPDDVCLSGVLPVSTPERTALDVAADAPFGRGVVVIDSALRSRQVSVHQLERRFSADRRKGVRGARRALRASDPRSGSVPETEARLLFAARGLPRPVSQRRVVVDGHSYVLDFAWDEAALAVEIDGFAYHSSSGDFQHDRERQNAVQLGGWLVLRFTVADLRLRPDRVVGEVWAGLTRSSPMHPKSVRRVGKSGHLAR